MLDIEGTCDATKTPGDVGRCQASIELLHGETEWIVSVQRWTNNGLTLLGHQPNYRSKYPVAPLQ